MGEEAKLAEGICTLCDQQDDYDHWIRTCPGGGLVAARCRHQRMFREWIDTLEEGTEQQMATLFLQMSEDEDGYRMILGNWSLEQYKRVRTAFPNP